MIHILADVLRDSILITALVILMMLLIEFVNVASHGHFFSRLNSNRFTRVLFGAAMGLIPGCMGGFATVSLYSHGMISFGALVAMMIASSGDEAFVMLAMFPGKALWIFLILFLVAVVTGLLVDMFRHRFEGCHSMSVHDEDVTPVQVHSHNRHFGWKRAVMTAGVLVFVAALLTGLLESDESDAPGGFNLLSEEWMYWLFAVLSLAVLGMLIFAGDHFVEEHLWEHIVCHHLPSIFMWTLGTLVLVGVLTSFFDISTWISDNTVLMILLAALIGVIPESGPHLVFVSLYAAGVVPLPVLMASCISQDGHASLPLLAQSRRSFLTAKAINVLIAILAGIICYLFLI